jgi:outer membrane protein OmpA-like peptidoglycan-associated protein
VRPSDLTPNAAARDLLDEVAEFLRDHEDTILLVRIDGFVVSAEAREPERARRLIEQSQSCANVVFQYLWRRRGVSAERMEAVGRGAASDRREPRGACGIELRVAVRR